MATQTGVQLITGSAKSEQASDDERIKVEAKSEDSLGNSYLAAGALFCAGCAAVLALAAATRGTRELSIAPGVLCAVALACLITQAAMGFPAKKALEEKLSAAPAIREKGSPLDALGAEISREVVNRIQVHPMPWFYAELAALGRPTLIFLNALFDRMRRASERRA